MAVVNGYATRGDVKSWLEVPDPDAELDPLIDDAVNASSRGIDNACKRHFFSVTETRVFDAVSAHLIRFGTWNDASAVTEVATDDDDDGTFETVWDAADFTLIPPNRQGAEVLPVRGVVAVGDLSFPRGGKRPGRSRVDATWGWAATPEAIREATVIQSARLVKRRKSPEGVVGLNMFGSVKVGRLDPDVAKLIKRYRLRTVG